MLRQYAPFGRFRMQAVHGRYLAVGTIPVGTIARTSLGTFRVDAWLPREIGAARRVAGRYVNRRVAREGHLALVTDLRTGQRLTCSDLHLIRADDAGDTR